MIEVLETWAGSTRFRLKVFQDGRGSFTKVFQETAYQAQGWPLDWKEQYVTVSRPGVVRGLHFQTPPHDHDKMVIVLGGEVADAVVDLRAHGSTYGQHRLFSLKMGDGVFVPRGFAHGFAATGERDAVLLYLTTSEYKNSHDSGILWNTLDIDWPVKDAIISDRDRQFVPFSGFVTPF